MLKKLSMIPAFALIILLTGCNLLGALNTPPTEPPAVETATSAPSPTPVTLAPTLSQNTLVPITLTPTATGQGGPTALPAPTQIGASASASVTPAAGTAAPVAGTPATSAPTATQPITSITDGIAIDPGLGEPGDLIHVIGKGFAPNEKITFHWNAASLSAATGAEYYSMNVDGLGNFDEYLYVPKADKWPGGAPKERDLLQLRVLAPSLGFNFVWANFTYVKRFNAGTSMVQLAVIDDFNYEIGLPNGWTWEWQQDDDDDERHQENVRFYNPAGAERGWIRVIETTDVSAAIATVMSLEGLTVASSANKTVGNFPGTEVKATNGRVVWFIPARNRVYALSFLDDSGNFYTDIGNTFKVK